jgi:hypothetical protein
MDNKKMLIETERMLITEFSTAYDIGMFELDSDKEVHRFLGNKPFTTIEQSRNQIEFITTLVTGLSENSGEKDMQQSQEIQRSAMVLTSFY